MHLSPVGAPLTPEALAILITQQSAIGGPVDITLDIGQSGFRTRALRTEIGLAREGGAPRFVGTVRATAVFGPNGAWSVVRLPGAAVPSAPLDLSIVEDGAPLIRSGAIVNPTDESPIQFPAVQGDTRFADAADLFREASPTTDYAFLQTTPTHAFLYRRPRIVKGQPAIISSLAPCFADAFARCTASTLFPPVTNCIELRDRAYRLAVNPANGRFRLDPEVNLPSPRGDLQISASPSMLTRYVYAGATLRLEIAEDRWSMEMPGFVLWSGFADVPEMTGLRARIIGATEQRAMLDEIDMLVNSDLESVLKFLPGFSPRDRPPPVELGASNLKATPKLAVAVSDETEFTLGLKFKFKALGQINLGFDSFEQEHGVTTGGLFFGAKCEFSIEARIPLNPPFFVELGMEFEHGGKIYLAGPSAGKSNSLIGIKAIVAAGVQFDFAIGEGSGKIGAGIIVEMEDGKWFFGGLVLIELELDLHIVTAKIGGELIGVKKEKSGKDVLEYEGEVAVNIKLVFIISIKMSLAISGDAEL